MPLFCSSTSLLTSDNLTLLRPLHPDLKLISLPILLINRYSLISSPLYYYLFGGLVAVFWISSPNSSRLSCWRKTTSYKNTACLWLLILSQVPSSCKLCTSLSLLFILCLFTPLCFTINCPGITLSHAAVTKSAWSHCSLLLSDPLGKNHNTVNVQLIHEVETRSNLNNTVSFYFKKSK